MKSAVFFFIIAGVLALLFFIFLGRANYRKEGDKSYDILVDFPFDLAFGKTLFSVLSRIAYLLFFLSLALIPLSYVFAGGGLNSMAIFLMAVSLFDMGAASGILFVPPSKTKPHVFSSLAFFFFGGLCSFFAGLFVFQFKDDYPLLAWVMSVLFWVLALAFILLMVNPKLANWAKMNVVESPYGSYLEKPRPFWLAFSQWLCLLLHIVLFVLLCISFTLIAFL